jgi:ketosteroid isomerase-like protein
MARDAAVTTRDDVDATNSAYAQAMADQDVDRMVGLYTPDARLFFSDTPMLQGLPAVGAFYDKELKEGPVVIKFDSVDVYEGGDLIVDVGWYATPGEHGKYVVVFQRQRDGTLKILVEADITDGLGPLG